MKNMYRSKVSIRSQALITCLVVANLMPAALAYDFPGKGSAADWSDALPYYNLGNKYLNQQRYSEAAEKYRQAIERYSYDPDFYINLGLAYRKMDDYLDAEQALRKAVELNDKDWTAWMDLGNAYLKQNRLKETLSAYEHALKCNPPAAEREGLKNDMKDIHRVLRNLGEEALPGETGKTAKTKKPVKGAASKSSAGKRQATPHPVPTKNTQTGKDWGYD